MPKAEPDVMWDVIARVKRKSKGDLDKACSAFAAELDKLDDDTLLRVAADFRDAMARARAEESAREQIDAYRGGFLVMPPQLAHQKLVAQKWERRLA